ncbi:uncharacterized protein LOC133185783 [Saccostrea echinata]|uniref:uncharacterized protein LOC133185783 n=1 Tax=Saccostrea echinata TaxID=191078 RepID=UPI002A80E792|nr:uncharacterized protein LOC133185783 [Saccostrea echinata]
MDAKLEDKKETSVKHKSASETEKINQTTKRKYTENEDGKTSEGNDDKPGNITNRHRNDIKVNDRQKMDNSTKRRKKKNTEPRHDSEEELVEGNKEFLIVAGPGKDRTYQCPTIQTHPKIKNPPPAPPPPQSDTRLFDLEATCPDNQYQFLA